MSTTKRRSIKRRTYTHAHEAQLLSGHDYFSPRGGPASASGGWGALREDDIGSLRAAWQVLAERCIERCKADHPGERPLGWWLFQAPPAYRCTSIKEAMDFRRSPEARQVLEDIGEVTEAEKSALRRRAHERTKGHDELLTVGGRAGRRTLVSWQGGDE